jgi:hypothetical protein
MEGVEASERSGVIEIMYNAKYGGFSFSDAAKELYYERSKKDRDKFSIWEVDRTDPVMVEIVKELGSRVNSTFSNIELKAIPAKYKTCYYISEYDGIECVGINHKKYKLDCIKKVIDSPPTSLDELVESIKAILSIRDETDSDDDESVKDIEDNTCMFTMS